MFTEDSYESVLFPAELSPGGTPKNLKSSQKNTLNTKNIEKYIKFTPQICVLLNLESRIKKYWLWITENIENPYF